MKHKYIKIKLHGGSSYIQPATSLDIANALDCELDGLKAGESVTLDIGPVEMTDKEYKNLPEFDGH